MSNETYEMVKEKMLSIVDKNIAEARLSRRLGTRVDIDETFCFAQESARTFREGLKSFGEEWLGRQISPEDLREFDERIEYIRRIRRCLIEPVVRQIITVINNGYGGIREEKYLPL